MNSAADWGRVIGLDEDAAARQVLRGPADEGVLVGELQPHLDADVEPPLAVLRAQPLSPPLHLTRAACPHRARPPPWRRAQLRPHRAGAPLQSVTVYCRVSPLLAQELDRGRAGGRLERREQLGRGGHGLLAHGEDLIVVLQPEAIERDLGRTPRTTTPSSCREEFRAPCRLGPAPAAGAPARPARCCSCRRRR